MGIFTRDEEELLQYDADAFFYFAGTMLLATLIPWSLLLSRRVIWPKPPSGSDFDARGPAPPDAVVQRCTTAAMEAKRREAQEAARAWGRRLGPGTTFQIVLVAFGWVCLGACVSRLRPITFDPHTALGLQSGASLREIKKAYRLKSLQHHPDKDRDNPLAPVVFQQINKAYRTLTDEAARRNYEKYGNPDGPLGMKVGIALHPMILLNKESRLTTLCIFFSVLFAVPLSIVLCCLWGSNVSAGGVCAETLRTFHACINSEIRDEDGPGLLSASAEAQRQRGVDLRALARAMIAVKPQPLAQGVIVEVRDGAAYNGRRGVLRRWLGEACWEVELWPVQGPPSSENRPDLQTFPVSVLSPAEPQVPCPFSDPPIRCCAALVWAHIWRLHAYMAPPVRSKLDKLLRLSDNVLRAVVSIAAHGQPGASHFEVVRGLVHFRRCLVQALEPGASPLLQLPHVSTVPDGAPSLRDVVDDGGLSPALLRELGLTEQQRLDVEAFCSHAPRAELSCSVGVADEESIAEGDLATLTVTLLRTNLAKNEAAGPVHAPLLPGPKFEEWWVMVYDERARRLVTTDLVLGTGRKETCKVHFMVPRSGKHRWTVHALCDSYAGLDASCPVHFDAVRRNQVSHEVFIHPEDAQIKTLFEELMEGLNPEEQEEDSDSEGEAGPAKVDTKAKTSTTPQESPCAKDCCSDEDSEADDEPEGLFHRVCSANGAYIYRCPKVDPKHRMGLVARGTVVRGFTEDRPRGWLELCWGGGAWICLDGDGDEPPPSDGKERPAIECIGSLCDQHLRTVVQTRTPLSLVKRWLKSPSATTLEAQDLRSISEVDDSRVRMMIEEVVRERIGDTRFEELLEGAQALALKHRKRLGTALGFFSSQNGIVCHVSPEGTVHGLHRDGSRIRDRVEVTEDDKLQIGPFCLDETRTCSCIHWQKTDDPTKSWVWTRDQTLSTRIRLGLVMTGRSA